MNNLREKVINLKQNFFITLLLIWVFFSTTVLVESVMHNEVVEEKDLQELDKVAKYLINKI